MVEPQGQLRSLLTGPALTAVLLAGMVLEARRYHKEADFEPFHARAAAAINGIPLLIGPWMGHEEPLLKEERDVLKPNAYRCIAFSDTRAAALDDPSRRVLLMIAQCRRANDMEGHYPPNCYPARGYAMCDVPGGTQDPDEPGLPRNWSIGGKTIPGMEYQFEHREAGRTIRTTVYNFMVLPEQGIKRDMKAINASAEDYQQRYYGAAQFQVVFGGSLAAPTAAARLERDAVFSELITPCTGVIRTLSEGDIKP
ncbi:MAG: exosortase-associated EpsI family protein [Tepidisphaeraceae bacterium]